MTAQNFLSKLKAQAGKIKKIIFFDSAFNLLILFLLFFIILSFTCLIEFNYLIFISIFLSITISAVLFLKKTKRYDVLTKISQKYPGCEECLKTAYDNINRDNVIIRSLMKDAEGEMEKIDTGTFFNKKQITFKVFLIIFLSFSLLSFTFIGESMAINNLLEEGNSYSDGKSMDRESEEKSDELEDERDIFGNKTELTTVGEPVPLEIKGYYSETGEGEEVEYESGENNGDENYETASSGERREYREDEILNEDSMLKEAIKEKYNRTG